MLKNIILLTIISIGSSSFGQNKQPKLVVGIVVDQMSYDYLYRFYDQFGADGFKKLMTKGSHFRNVTYNYVPTYTGPGHASIYTGTTPSNHGIVANDWYASDLKKSVNCVDDTTVKSLGGTSNDGLRSPVFLRANTITDQLKLTYPKSRVVGVSIKDRSAILPAGHLADGAYWYDFSTGNFITSSFYSDSLKSWNTEFRKTNGVDNYLKQSWNLLYPIEKYTYGKQDNSPYEQLLGGKTTPTFPYDFTGLPRDQQLELFTSMPSANTYLTDFALHAMQSEQLGIDKTTDFLTISYSTPDIAGHAFGPYSLEMEDMYLRLDKEIARLISALDLQAGKGNYVLFLTADHAVVPVPKFLQDNQLPGGYLYLKAKIQALKEVTKKQFGMDVVLRIDNNNVYFTEQAKNSNLYAAIQVFVQQEVARWSEVKAVYTADQLSYYPSSDVYFNMTRAGYDVARSGQVIYLLQPGFLTKSEESEKGKKGTSHGSAYNYDTHVPVLFYGQGIPAQSVVTAYEITDIAASLVHILNVQRPNAMTGKPMLELFKDKK